jgi:hypothetical protein
MECFICKETKDERLIPTLCGCKDMQTHLSCIKGKNKTKCTICDRRYHGEVFSKLIDTISTDSVEVRTNRVVVRTRKIPYIKIFAALSLISSYIGVGYFLVNKYHNDPKEIKTNQVEVVCNVTSIEYAFDKQTVRNNLIVDEFKVISAFGNVLNIENIDMKKLFDYYSCRVCPEFILRPCAVYIKNNEVKYLAADKYEIEERFNSGYYLAFLIPAGLLLIFVLGILIDID